VFVTEGTYTATSTDISVYNADVNNEANAGGSPLASLGLTWTAIASTSSVSAYDNIGGVFTAPIYNLGGQLVADGSAGLWNFGLDIDNPIDFDEGGVERGLLVWTGTDPDGLGFGPNVLGGSEPIWGFYQDDNYQWVDDGEGSAGLTEELYAISPILTVPGSESPATPEPGTVSPMMLGGILLARRVRYLRAHATSGPRS
jgi:hypothetical protein